MQISRILGNQSAETQGLSDLDIKRSARTRHKLSINTKSGMGCADVTLSDSIISLSHVHSVRYFKSSESHKSTGFMTIFNYVNYCCVSPNVFNFRYKIWRVFKYLKYKTLEKT